MSRVDQLFAAYPNANNAVGYVEMVFCDADGLCPGQPTPWQMIQKAMPEADPEKIASLIRSSCEGSEPGDGPNDASFLAKALREMDTQDFRRYLAAKMGAL